MPRAAVDRRTAARLRLVSEVLSDPGRDVATPTELDWVREPGPSMGGDDSVDDLPVSHGWSVPRPRPAGHGEGNVAGRLAIRDRLAVACARCDVGLRGVVALAVVGVLAAVFAGVIYLRARPVAVPVGASGASSASLASQPVSATPPLASPAAPAASVLVDVAGRVRRPGVVRLPAGARVADAVRAAGGPLTRKDLGLLNLASRLTDGEQVVVGLPAGAGAGAVAGTVGPTDGSSAAPAPVDVNTATGEELDTLPGVGPVLARRILDYRAAHGAFHSVEELAQVPGIGPSKLADLRPLVML
jgi:competence protein ComEA